MARKRKQYTRAELQPTPRKRGAAHTRLDWSNPEYAEKIRELAGTGCTMQQIASCLGIGRATLYEAKGRHPDIADALERGRDQGIANVTNALYQSALSGNLGAQVFYLKNRDSGNWRDTRHSEVQSTVRGVVSAEPLSVDQWLDELRPADQADDTLQ